jgi:hypothetical protein
MSLNTPVSLTLAAVAVVELGTSVGSAEAMQAYQWKKRPLVVFAPNDDHVALSAQRAVVMAHRGGFAERDVVVIYVVGTSVTGELGPGPGLSAEALRSRFGVPADVFRVVLIGKDGGSKLSSGAPLSVKALFGTIDAMPMRRQEMRRS